MSKLQNIIAETNSTVVLSKQCYDITSLKTNIFFWKF